jgi:hypothetical protein
MKIMTLARINLGLAALQPLSAGFFLSGYGHAVAVHRGVALALQVGALIQAITAVVLCWRGRVPAQAAGRGIGLFVMVSIQLWLGFHQQYWLHVPLGVGIIGSLMRQVSRRDTADTVMRVAPGGTAADMTGRIAAERQT